MKMKILTLVMAVAFTVSVVGVGFAAKCEVTGVEGSVVTLDCGADAGKVVKGDKVELKKAKKAPEGC